MPPVVALLEDLLLVGDFDALTTLVSVLTTAAPASRRPPIAGSTRWSPSTSWSRAR